MVQYPLLKREPYKFPTLARDWLICCQKRFNEQTKSVVELVEAINLTQLKLGSSIVKLNSLADFLQSEPDNLVPVNKILELKALGQKKLKDLTLEEMRLIDSAIKHLVKLNELKDKLIIKGKIREFKAIRSQAIGNIEFNHSALNGSLDGMGFYARRIRKASLEKTCRH